jgi:hypothetical protein
VGAELLHADRRTDITKLTVAFRNYAKSVWQRIVKDAEGPVVHLFCEVLGHELDTWLTARDFNQELPNKKQNFWHSGC